MDITLLFKACVKTIRTRNKALGTVLPGYESFEKPKLRQINGRLLERSEFIHKAKDIVGQITRLRDFLLEHKKAYLNFSGIRLDIPDMSDYERDKIDSGAQRIMKTCSHVLLEFKREFAVKEFPQQLIEHQDSVLDLIENYLKNVCKIYSEQKAIRMKRTLDAQKMSKLNPEPAKDSVDKVFKRKSAANSGEFERRNSSNIPGLSSMELETSPLLQDENFTSEELQMFESENEQLYNEFNTLSEEVHQIESKVVHIAELQEIFTEKVLEQDKDAERIVGTAIGTTENIKDANTQIRQAMQTNAGLRIYVLFFLLVMSLTLLFLDWYND